MSEDPLESRLRSLLQDQALTSAAEREDRRLDQVLHKAHIRGGVFDLINLFTRWGWVLSEGSTRGAPHLKPVKRTSAGDHAHEDNQ